MSVISNHNGEKKRRSRTTIYFPFLSRALLERSSLLQVRWELWEIGVLLAAFGVAQFVRLSCLPFMLRLSSSAALNVSLLSTDFYAIMAGVLFFRYTVSSEKLSIGPMMLLILRPVILENLSVLAHSFLVLKSNFLPCWFALYSVCIPLYKKRAIVKKNENRWKWHLFIYDLLLHHHHRCVDLLPLAACQPVFPVIIQISCQSFFSHISLLFFISSSFFSFSRSVSWTQSTAALVQNRNYIFFPRKPLFCLEVFLELVLLHGEVHFSHFGTISMLCKRGVSNYFA